MPGHRLSLLEGGPALNAQGYSRMPEAVRREPPGVQPHGPESLLDYPAYAPGGEGLAGVPV